MTATGNDAPEFVEGLKHLAAESLYPLDVLRGWKQDRHLETLADAWILWLLNLLCDVERHAGRKLEGPYIRRF